MWANKEKGWIVLSEVEVAASVVRDSQVSDGQLTDLVCPSIGAKSLLLKWSFCILVKQENGKVYYAQDEEEKGHGLQGEQI
jgi:hypothetical protein